MRQSPDGELPPLAKRSSDWGVAVAIALSIVICLAAFIWIFVELDPLLSDFTGTDTIVTPEPVDPAASPSDGTESSDPIATP